MCGEFGEVTVIIGINFLAVGTLLLNSRDTLSYFVKAHDTNHHLTNRQGGQGQGG